MKDTIYSNWMVNIKGEYISTADGPDITVRDSGDRTFTVHVQARNIWFVRITNTLTKAIYFGIQYRQMDAEELLAEAQKLDKLYDKEAGIK